MVHLDLVIMASRSNQKPVVKAPALAKPAKSAAKAAPKPAVKLDLQRAIILAGAALSVDHDRRFVQGGHFTSEMAVALMEQLAVVAGDVTFSVDRAVLKGWLIKILNAGPLFWRLGEDWLREHQPRLSALERDSQIMEMGEHFDAAFENADFLKCVVTQIITAVEYSDLENNANFPDDARSLFSGVIDLYAEVPLASLNPSPQLPASASAPTVGHLRCCGIPCRRACCRSRPIFRVYCRRLGGHCCVERIAAPEAAAAGPHSAVIPFWFPRYSGRLSENPERARRLLSTTVAYLPPGQPSPSAQPS